MCLRAVRGRPPYVAAIPCWPGPSMARRGRSRARRSHLPVSVHLQSNAGALMVRPPVEGDASTDLPYRLRQFRISRGGRWSPMASRACLTAAPAGQGGLCGRGGANQAGTPSEGVCLEGCWAKEPGSAPLLLIRAGESRPLSCLLAGGRVGAMCPSTPQPSTPKPVYRPRITEEGSLGSGCGEVSH